MWNDNQDTEFFISCVRDRPALWDKDMEDYTNRGIREQLWADIAEIVFSQEWPQLDTKGRADKVKDIKNRWRHMRDSYIKYLKGSQSKKRKRGYLHAASLKFIGDLMRRKSDCDYNQSEEDEEMGGADDNSFIKMEAQYVTPEVSLVDEDYPSIQLSSDNLLERTFLESARAFNNFSSATRSPVFKPEHAEPSTSTVVSEQDEADKLFMLSILPDYKKLSEDEKIDFRIMVLQYFRDSRRKRDLKTPNTTKPNCVPKDMNDKA